MSKAITKAEILRSITELGPQTRNELRESTQLNETTCKRMVKVMYLSRELYVHDWIKRNRNQAPYMAVFGIRNAGQSDKTHPNDMPQTCKKSKKAKKAKSNTPSQNSSTAIGKRNRAKVFNLITGERTSADIHDVVTFSLRHVQKHIAHLKANGKIHISEWRENQLGRKSPIYARGNKPDAPYPHPVYGRSRRLEMPVKTYKLPTKSYAGNPFGFLIEQMTP